METQFKIGYPHASAIPGEIRDSAVILQPINYPGFENIFFQGKKYTFQGKIDGSEILDKLENQGVVGTLIESMDDRESIVKDGEIYTEGTSMCLALVLAVFAHYSENQNQLPLLLFSADIDCPLGAKLFIDAKIKPYQKEIDKNLTTSLVEKYKAAKFAKSYALILVERDAEILGKTLKKDWKSLEQISPKVDAPEEPFIISVKENQLPNLAEKIGISRFHYSRTDSPNQQRKLRNKAGLSFTIFLAILLLLLGVFFLTKNDRNNNFQGKDLEYANLEGVNLQGADLTDANLERVNLSNRNLEGAILKNANLRTKLIGANLYKTDLRGANLIGAYLQNANLKDADLTGANLRGSSLHLADLTNADLTKANLERVEDLEVSQILKCKSIKHVRGLSDYFMTMIQLEKPELVKWWKIGSSKRNFEKANLQKADLRKLNLQGSNFKKANLRDANLYLANLTDANFEGADLRNANLRARLIRANLSKANLKGANLIGAYLQNASLKDANLIGVDLRGSRLHLTDLTNADLTKANLVRVEKLQISQIIKCKSLDYITGLSDDFMRKIKKEKPELMRWWKKNNH